MCIIGTTQGKGEFMGHATAIDIKDTGLSLREQLTWHLRGNHYPPIPSSMVDPCILAVNLASNGEWDSRVELPEGITYRGEDSAPAHAIVEQHHLEAWVITDEEFYA
jgi:hypothetical protein